MLWWGFFTIQISRWLIEVHCEICAVSLKSIFSETIVFLLQLWGFFKSSHSDYRFSHFWSILRPSLAWPTTSLCDFLLTSLWSYKHNITEAHLLSLCFTINSADFVMNIILFQGFTTTLVFVCTTLNKLLQSN